MEAPTDARAHYELGMAYKSVMRYLEAEACFRQVLELEGKGGWASAAKIELAREADSVEREKRILAGGPIGRARLRLRRFMYTNPNARILFLAPIGVAAVIWTWIFLHGRR